LPLAQSLKHHGYAQRIVRPESHLFAPMRIEQITGIEADRLRDQCPVGIVRGRLDRGCRSAEELGQLARSQGKPGDHAQTAAAATLDAPEQFRMGAGIRNQHFAIGGDDLRFQ
jgi:hypothetical protein